MARLENLPYRFAVGDWDSQLKRLHAMNYRAAIVGRQGSGKSTLLEQLHRRLPGSHYLNLPHSIDEHAQRIAEALTQAESGHCLLIDGIERIRWRARESLYRATRSSGMVVVLHRRGRFPTWIRCRTSRELMQQLLNELGLDQPAHRQLGLRAFDVAKGNLRDALRWMYDRLAHGDDRQAIQTWPARGD